MGYRIMYSPEKQNQYPQKAPRKLHSKTVWICAITAIAVFLASATGVTETIGDFLLPGDAAQIRQAAFGMIEQIRLGTPVGEAITAFCVEIVGHGLQSA